MVFPDTVLSSVKEAIKSSERLPHATTYAVFELDIDGGQANVMPPVVEITTEDVVRTPDTLNTEFVGYATDNSGNHIGKRYRTGFEMPLQIDVWTVEGDEYDHETLGNDVRMALYRYDTSVYEDPLPDPNGSGVLNDVTGFTVDSGNSAPDLTMTPALRRWRQNATVRFEEVIDTSIEYEELPYIDTVHTPADGDAEAGTDIEIVFDATTNQTSPADEHT